MAATPKSVVLLTIAFVLPLLSRNTSFACVAICSSEFSCTGQECYCNGSYPVCIGEAQETVASLNAKAGYARSFNTPGLNRFADTAQKIADGIAQSDRDVYFLGTLEREDALKLLTAKERQILNSWDGGNSKLPGTMKKQ